MATGKYGMKINPYGIGYAPTFSTTDPWYNVGALLGSIWGNNYNKRGVQRGVDEAKQKIEEMNRQMYGENIGTAGSEYTTGIGATNIGVNSVSDLYNNTDPNKAIGAGEGFENGAFASALPPQQANVTIGRQQIQPQNFIQAPLSAVTTKYVDANESMGLPKSNIPNMNSDVAYASANQQMGIPEAATLTETIPRDLSAEKLDYIANKYSTSDNPDGDRAIVGMTANTVKNNIAQVDANGVPIIDPKQYQGAIRAELIKNGRTPYQIDQIMEMISPDIESKVNSAKDVQFNRYYDLYKQQVQADEYDKSALTYARMKQLNPALAEGLSGQFKRNQSDFLTDYEIERTAQKFMKYDPTLSKQQAYNMAIYKKPYSMSEQIAMGATRVGGVGRGVSSAGASYGTGTTRSSGGTRSGGTTASKGTAYGSWNGIKYGGGEHKAMQAEYDNLTALENPTSAQRKRINDLGYALEQIGNSVTLGVPPSREERVAEARYMLDNGILPEQMLQGLDLSSLEYSELSAIINEAAQQREQEANEREAENARSKAAGESQAAQAQATAQEKAQEEYDATHRHGLLGALDSEGGFFGWMRGARNRVFGE